MQGLIETEDGKVFELDSPKGSTWLESIGSFRYEPTGGGKPYTVRKEASAYWYGCRKIEGKVRKKYIGKSSEVSVAKLEEIAEALEILTEPRVKQVAQVAERVAEVPLVAQVAEGVAQDRLTALEVQVADLQKVLEALQEALPGKSELGDYLELPKVDNEVTERLQNELGNLRAENDELRSKLETEEVRLTATVQCYREIQDESYEEASAEKSKLQQELEELSEERTDREKEIAELRSEVSDLKQKSATAGKDFPDAADLLNQLKAKRKKSKTDLADMEAILEILEG